MEQKHLDEMEDSFFGEETIDDDYPILKVKEKKEEKKEEKKSTSVKVVKSVQNVSAVPKKRGLGEQEKRENRWDEEKEEILIKPARMETPLKELVREAKPELKSETKLETKPVYPVPIIESIPSVDPENAKNKVETKFENNSENSAEASSGGWALKWLIFLLILLIIAAIFTNGFGLYHKAVVTEPIIPSEEFNPVNSTNSKNLSEPVNMVSTSKKSSLPVTTEKDTALTVLAKKWMFDPNTLYVKTGENIQLAVKSMDLDFIFSIPDLGIQTTVSGITLINFTPKQPGTYKFKCSSCDSWKGMEGQLIVK